MNTLLEKFDDAVLNLQGFTLEDEWKGGFVDTIKQLLVEMRPKLIAISDEHVEKIIKHINNMAAMAMWSNDPDHIGSALIQMEEDAKWLKVYDNTLNQLIKEFNIDINSSI